MILASYLTFYGCHCVLILIKWYLFWLEQFSPSLFWFVPYCLRIISSLNTTGCLFFPWVTTGTTEQPPLFELYLNSLPNTKSYPWQSSGKGSSFSHHFQTQIKSFTMSLILKSWGLIPYGEKFDQWQIRRRRSPQINLFPLLRVNVRT